MRNVSHPVAVFGLIQFGPSQPVVVRSVINSVGKNERELNLE
jgi:hypothetical protein